MIKKYNKFLDKINEESGIKNISKLAKDVKEAGNFNFEIWLHQDLDGVISALCMKKYLEDYGLKLLDTHIIQYGGLEFAVKNKQENSLAVLVDFAHGKRMFQIHTDHHDKQSGVETTGVSFKTARSNAETISGEISPSDIFTSNDIELVKTVDSADFLAHGIAPEDVENSIFNYKREKPASKNRFMMGLVVNRLLLALKNKRITVASLDGKRDHINKNLLECLVMDCTPSLYSMFNNIKHYINSAVSLEWNKTQRKQNVPTTLLTPEEISQNLSKYIDTRKPPHKDINFIEGYNILQQYGIGAVFNTGSYDRYVVFKNFPQADFVCTTFPMGLVQVSCNPFKEKALKQIDLGEIAKEVLGKFKYQLSNINISISDIKKISEEEIEKMQKKYGQTYQGVGFKYDELKAFYKDLIIELPNRRSNDMKTKSKLDLNDEKNPDVILLKKWMDIPFIKWPDNIKKELSWLKIPIWNIIEESSGGHASITNIQGLTYLKCRYDLLKLLFGKTLGYSANDNDMEGIYVGVLKMIADKFIEVLKQKIDLAKKGRKITYDTANVNLKGTIVAENFEYFIKDEETKKVSKSEFIEFGMNLNFEPKKDSEKGFKMDIEDNKVIGYYESNSK